jgi:predicted CoA-binding protein
MENVEKVLVIGASSHPYRYSHMAIKLLRKHGHEVIALGKERNGEVADVPIVNSWNPKDEPVDTITLYLNPTHQESYLEDIISSGANRLIFNPGTENVKLAEKARAAGIEVDFACTLVLLNTGQF